MSIRIACLAPVAALLLATSLVAQENNQPPEGFRALFNGKDFTNWHGERTEDPVKRAALPPEELKVRNEEDAKNLLEHWRVENGEIVNDGQGVYLTTDEKFGDIELLLDFKIQPKGDSGVYLRNTPQIQIWDFTYPDYFKLGADKGSGGLWNNSPGAPGKDPLVLADNPIGEWNRFRIIQVGDKTTIWLNDKLVVDNATLENYWDRSRPLYPTGSIQLQTHGSEMRWRNIFVREIPPEEANQRLRGEDEDQGFTAIFNGENLEGWTGDVDSYAVQDGSIVCQPGKSGKLFTEKEYDNFIVRLEFKLPPGGNNGLAIRYPGTGNPAYSGMCELQVLDDYHEKYAKLDPRQYHGSAYGMVAAHRGYLRPAGEWNYQQVTVDGSRIKVELNGYTILNADLSEVTEFMADTDHPGKDRTSGHFGFSGHTDPVAFRNISIKPIEPQP